MAHYGFFCTQYLLYQYCDRKDSCIFRHVSNVDVKLDEPIPNGSEFVKGYYLDEFGYPARSRNRVTDARAKYCYSRLPCYYNRNGKKCPYENSCLYSHTGIYWDKRNIQEEMDRNPIPSTSSSISKCNTSSSSLADVSDDECLGATALITPYNKPTSNTSSTKLETQNQKNLCDLNINAPEFVPRTKRLNSTVNSKKRLCPYAERDGLCKYPPGECTYLHGDMCDLCTRPALHPYNEELRKKHTQDCIKRHERDMELAFAVARSKEKICGICFEAIMQKSSDEQRFGILPSCNHCFCLACIRRWRQSKQFENKIIRSCPECRIPSDFVCPSPYWVDTKEDKDKVIDKYKLALSKKDCKYFKHGRGHCPFGNKCFYRHCLHNGKKVDVGPPPSSNNLNNSDHSGEMPVGVEIIQRILMMELHEMLHRDDIADFMEIEDFLDMLSLSSDDDDDYEWSDYLDVLDN